MSSKTIYLHYYSSLRITNTTSSYLIIACSSINPVNDIDIHIPQSFGKRKKLQRKEAY